MNFHKHNLAALLLLALAGGAAMAASTINPSVPAPNSPMASAPIRNNFQASYNDVNNLQKKFNGSVSPVAPNAYQDWVDITTPTAPNWKMYVGGSWVSVGAFNCSGSPCTWAPGGTYVTASGTLTTNRIMLGAGTSVVQAMGSAGTGTQVLLGGSPPTWGSVDLTTMVGSSILPVANGGTGNAFTGFSGPASSAKTYTLPNASTTILTTNAGVTNAQLATMAADTFKMNATGSTTTPTDVSMPNCPDSGGNHINYATSTHTMSCGTSGATSGQLWNVILSGTQSLSTSTMTLLHANSATFDPSSVCNTSSTWVCTPTAAGYYLVTCGARIDGTNGPTARADIGQVAIYKNGIAGTLIAKLENAAQTNLAAVATTSWTQVTGIVQVNGSTDTIACAVYGDNASGQTVINGFWTGNYIHP